MITSKKIRILIVDDSSNLRKVIIRYIEMWKPSEYTFEFEEAENGIAAEEKLQEAMIFGIPFDIIFLDWMMPKMTGYDFMKKIRGIEVFKISPAIIMLTAETNSEQINACQKFGVAKYIIKPFTHEMINGTLKELLEGKADGGVKYAI